MIPVISKIRSLIPAPGFRAVACVVDDDNDAVEFSDVPVIGWAVVRYERSNVRSKEDSIELFVWDSGADAAIEVDHAFIGNNAAAFVLAPGEALTEEVKNHFASIVRRRMDRLAKDVAVSEIPVEGI